jgi:hypothetical protein
MAHYLKLCEKKKYSSDVTLQYATMRHSTKESWFFVVKLGDRRMKNACS